MNSAANAGVPSGAPSAYLEALAAAAALLRGSDSILLLCHDSPDGDTLGSAAALRGALRAMGKRCDLSPGGEVSERLRFVAEGAVGPAELDPDGYRLIVAVDTAEQKLLGANEPLAPRVDLVIDHHRTSRPYGRGGPLRLPEAAATGEIIFDLIGALGVPLTREVALPLYVALATDTGCFRYSNTTARTFEVAAALAATGIEMAGVNRSLFELISRRTLALQNRLLSEAVFAADGAICVAVLTREMAEGASKDDTGGLSGFLRNIEGVEAVALLKETEEGDFKVSMRSNGGVDVAAVCAAFGGGGHTCAAGCRIPGPAEEAQRKLLERLCAAYPGR